VIAWGRSASLAGAGSGARYASSPLLASPTPAWRSRLFLMLMALACVALLGRAVWVQVIHTKFYQEKGKQRFEREIVLQASRGRILDRNGQILAASVPVTSLWVDPKRFEANSLAQREQLAQVLGMSTEQLNSRLAENANFVWLRRRMDDGMSQKARALELKGVNLVNEFRRRYPMGEAAAQLVGLTKIEELEPDAQGCDAPEPGIPRSRVSKAVECGLDGMELSQQAALSGIDGFRKVIKSKLGQVVEDVQDVVEPVDGHDVTLAMDARLQSLAFQAVRDAVQTNKANAGSAVVLDAKNGEVLALVNYPSYSPEDRSRTTPAQMRNRVLGDAFEPGSTMKPFAIAQALETGRVTPKTVIATGPGHMSLGGFDIRDHQNYGSITIEEVVQKSSNVGTAKVALQMPASEMHDVLTRAGFGQKPALTYPEKSVTAGRLAPARSWSPTRQAAISRGYAMSASLLQLAQGYTVFATDGELLTPTLLRKDPAPGQTRAHGAQVFSAQTAKTMRQMLERVTGPGGTAPKAQLTGYSTGGKTGTAHKIERSTYESDRYNAVFVGIAPISQPRIVVAVMIDDPRAGKYFGGDVAAPVFSQIAQDSLRHLGVAPDLDIKPGITVNKDSAVQESL
jgi:cell division protein FtsI (penicillin-binding protein 3)